MKKQLLIGLGNPGAQYEFTRHNLGARVVAAWQAQQLEGLPHIKIYLPQPDVFMNDTGPAIAAFLKREGLTPEDLLIVHDDVELPLGVIKDKLEGSAAGHNGVRSIQETLGTQAIRRLRIGVGRPTDATPLEAFVLQKFSSAEETELPAIMAQASKRLATSLGL